MKKLTTILLLFAWVLILGSCNTFLKEYSQDLVYANSIHDLSELLVGSGYAPTDVSTATDLDFTGFHVMDDDVVFLPVHGTDLNRELGFYYWQANPFKFAQFQVSDPVWSWIYEKLGALNVVLVKAEEFRTEDPENYRRVIGEAHFLRAYYYFHLVNLYAKPYNSATADQDPGVPIKLTEYIEDKFYGRASVSEVYKLVLEDLDAAITNLENVQQKSIYRATETAAHALLSRVYLYMNKWQEADDECEIVLKSNYSLLDMNGFAGKSFTTGSSSETIFSMGQNKITGENSLMPDLESVSTMTYYLCSENLLDCYEEGDLRLGVFFVYSPYMEWGDVEQPCSRKQVPGETDVISDRWAIRLPEIYLNRAEAQFMLGHETEAKQALQKLREKRFENNQAPDINKSGKALLEEIWKERRRELCFEGHRWFDLRRYAVNGKYPTSYAIVHKLYIPEPNHGYVPIEVGESVLEGYPNDNAWVLPIPDYAIIFNEGVLVQNDKRKERVYQPE